MWDSGHHLRRGLAPDEALVRVSLAFPCFPLVSLGFPWFPLASLGFPWLLLVSSLLLRRQARKAQSHQEAIVQKLELEAKVSGAEHEPQAGGAARAARVWAALEGDPGPGVRARLGARKKD